MSAPSFASRRQMARPMPLDPPVTSAVFPFSGSISPKLQAPGPCFGNSGKCRVRPRGVGPVGLRTLHVAMIAEFAKVRLETVAIHELESAHFGRIIYC